MDNSDYKSSVSHEKIIGFLGQRMCVDLKNHHMIKGTLVFYHLTEQMIHLTDWEEYKEDGALFREGKYIVINRTAWFQIYI